MTYEYVCTTCHHQWEADQSIKEAPLKVCPSCKKNTAKRQISGGTGFVLKGGGWYSDLYGSPNPSKSKDTDSDVSSSEDKGKKDKKADSKPSSDKSSTASSDSKASKGDKTAA